MNKEKCEICGKEIEGYNEQHCKFLLKQHQLSRNCQKVAQNGLKSFRNEIKEDDKR